MSSSEIAKYGSIAVDAFDELANAVVVDLRDLLHLMDNPATTLDTVRERVEELIELYL